MKRVVLGWRWASPWPWPGVPLLESRTIRRSTPKPEAPSTVRQGTDADAFKENIITLNDGRTGVCLDVERVRHMERDQGQRPGLRLGEDEGMTVCEHCGEPMRGATACAYSRG